MENAIRTFMAGLGENIEREGLQETPKRYNKALQDLTKGYHQDPSKLIKTFPAEGTQELILLKDIELYSLCEHHILPFFGKAHIAYIPREKILGRDRVMGASKLARILDMYARRLQIQERIGEQVTNLLMNTLQPKGAACIIEAAHLCMRMRGVEKQNSILVTSSLKGIFLTQDRARNELLKMIGL